MTIKHMRIFVVVYQQMNVTRAAKILHMTQPAVTRSIREIEKYYNISLFERINKRLYKTEIGDRLYARALHIVDAFDRLEKGLKNYEEEGVLRIGSTITIGSFILPQLVREYQKEHSQMQIKVKVSNCKQIQQAILDNQVDLALIEGECQSEQIYSELLSKDHLRLIMSENHPLSEKEKIYMRDLADYPMLAREEGSAGRTYLDNIMGAHGLTVDPVWESASSSALIQAVEKNIGISILPEKIIQEKIEERKVICRKIEDEAFERNNYLIWHKQKYLTRTAKQFIEMSKRYMEYA